MAWCLPPKFSQAFLEALKDGTIDPGKLVDMDSAGRRAFFAKIVGDEHAQEVNANFESKLLLKDWKRGLVSWAKSTAGITTPVRRDMLNKILKMDKILSPADEKAFLADLAAKKLGTQVTVDEAAKITQLAQAAAKARASNAGSTFGMSEDFANKAAALEHYVKAIEPTTVVAEIRDNVITTMRNMVLMNPSTPIKTTIGQTENSVIEAITRRLATRSLAGAAPAVKADLQRQAWRFFRDTGFNPSIMESYEDSGRLGEHSNFDLPEGMLSSSPALRKIEQVTRTIAKVSNKIAIDYEHVFTFTKFHQMAFFDAAHIGATNIANAEIAQQIKAKAAAKARGHAYNAPDINLKERTEELLRDAAKIKPETEDGKILRADAQQQAARVTSINDTYLAGFALGVKNFLNGKIVFKGSDKLKIPKTGLGDLLMPVAKIPANIIWNGIDNAGAGLPIAVNDIWRGKQKLASTDAKTRLEGMTQYAAGWRRMARIVGVLGASALFASMFGPDDFRTDRFGANYVKIGGLWINMEYISFMSPAMAGMLTVKKDVHDSASILKTIESYGAGVFGGLKNAPGVDTVGNFVTSLTSNKDKVAGVWEYLKGRLVPAPVHNLMRDRPYNRLLFGAHGVESDEDVAADHEADAERAAQRRESNLEYQQQ